MNKLKWRLTKLPTVDELTLLVEKNIVTKEEAKEILFNNETDESRDKDSLKDEIKFLRGMIEKLADKSRVSSIVYEYRDMYPNVQWYTPYYSWSNQGYSFGNSSIALCGASDTMNCNTSNSLSSLVDTGGSSCSAANFSEIQTF